VPDFLPFAGVRYDQVDVGAVAAPPYDVIDEDERANLEAADSHNSVRLILPRGEEPYAAAADWLARWRAEGVLIVDDQPRFYLYEMEYEDEEGRTRHTHGVVGALELGDVLPHERTMPKAKSDRLALLRATRANLDPIWCLSLAQGLSELVRARGTELATCIDGEGVRHRLRALDDETTAGRISEAVAGAPVVIADGHHRFETACAYRDEHPDDPAAGSIMALVVELADDELHVQPIHRLLSNVADFDLRDALAATDAGPSTPEGVAGLQARMRDEGGLGLVDRAGLAFIARPPGTDVDATVFDEDIRPRLPADVDIGYRSDASTVASLVEKGVVDAVVLLRPVTVPQIRDAAFAGVRMPEKTSFFHPKPRTGMVFRILELR
jgi:uncharacterized protein (DUF1015 family)